MNLFGLGIGAGELLFYVAVGFYLLWGWCYAIGHQKQKEKGFKRFKADYLTEFIKNVITGPFEVVKLYFKIFSEK